MMAGVDMAHVPYRGGGPALADLVGRQVQVLFPTMARRSSTSGPAVARARGDDGDAIGGAPDIPTVGEFVPGYEASSGYGLGAPKKTPTEIVDKLNREINAALADPKPRRSLPTSAAMCCGLAGDFGKLIADETEEWAKAVKFSGAKAD